MRSISILYCTLICIILISVRPNVLASGPGDWVLLGNANTGVTPYNLLYYKLIKVNSNTDRYASIIELNVAGDANFFNRQGTYLIRVDKYEGTLTGRFDGVEIKCISGNPSAATFYVFNNALWVRSNYQWGILSYRDTEFNNSPLNTAPFEQTITAPVGFVASTSSYGLKCDFDSSKYYQLPYEDVQGNMAVAGKIGIGTVPNYPLHIVSPGNVDRAAAYLWGENYGVSVGTLNATASNFAFAVFNNMNTSGSPAAGGSKSLLYVRGDGNVGIGTNVPKAKLAVNGDLLAQKIKVTMMGWPDHVFQPDYQLPSLQDVEHFIRKNKHLPDIPAEAEVVKDGLDLGDMNKKLLQKIEELTLYIIDLKKDSRKQQEEIDNMKKQMKL